MNIAILDDYQDTIRTLACFSRMAGHKVTIWNDHTKDIDTLAARLKDTEALALIRERTPIRAPLIERLPTLRMISQGGVFPHIDVEACTGRGILVCSRTGPGRPSYATAELTWGLVIAALRHIPQEMAALKAGKWQAYPIGIGLRGKTLGIYGYGKIGAVVAGYGKAFGMNALAWGRENSIVQAQKDGVTVAASKDALFAESRLRGRAAARRAPSAARDGQRDLRAAPRLRRARRARAHVHGHLRPDPRLRRRQADQRREPGCATALTETSRRRTVSQRRAAR